MNYENFDEAAELVKEIKALERELEGYKSRTVCVAIRDGGGADKMETWPFYGDSDTSAFNKYATEMLVKLSQETEAKIANLKAHLETL